MLPDMEPSAHDRAYNANFGTSPEVALQAAYRCDGSVG